MHVTRLIINAIEVVNYLSTYNKLVDIIRLVARLFQQVQYSHDITILLQPCIINLVTFLLYHDQTCQPERVKNLEIIFSSDKKSGDFTKSSENELI